MKERTKGKEKAIRWNFSLTSTDMERLRQLSQGNMSYTVRRLIEQAWVYAQEQTQGQQQEV